MGRCNDCRGGGVSGSSEDGLRGQRDVHPELLIVLIIIAVIVYRYREFNRREDEARREIANDEWAARRADLDAQIEAAKKISG